MFFLRAQPYFGAVAGPDRAFRTQFREEAQAAPPAYPAGPGMITSWSVGPQPDRIVLKINALPPAGDSTVAGNNLGTITGLQYRIGAGQWVSLGSITVPNTWTIMVDPATAPEIWVRALGYDGREGLPNNLSLALPPTLATDAWKLDTGADENELVVSGITPVAGRVFEAKIGNGDWVPLTGSGPWVLTGSASRVLTTVDVRVLVTATEGISQNSSKTQVSGPAFGMPAKMPMQHWAFIQGTQPPPNTP